MQKELKIGLAIGALLLVVLIVYLAVPNTESDLAQSGDGSTESSMTDEQNAPETLAETSTETVGTTAKDAKPNDPFGDAAPVSESTVANADTDFDWANIVETGQLPVTTTPPLRAVDAPTLPAAEPVPSVPTETTIAGSSEVSAPVEPVVDSPRDTSSESLETTYTTPVAPAAPTGARTHTLQKGETYASIAKAVYGAERYYLAIDKANPTLNPTRLRPGTVINLPDINVVNAEEAPAIAAPAARSASISEGEYRVANGDSLYKIALKHYGSSNMVDAIYEANKQTIGSDSSRVRPGMILKMPAKP